MTRARWHYAPSPISVPTALLDGFERLEAKAVLVGGAAVQVWVGRRDGIFATGDLDFITHLTVSDLVQAGVCLTPASGRHVVVDGMPIEFPSGPLGVGDYIYTPGEASVEVPTLDGRPIFCLRPEASVLDRLAWVAGDQLEVGYAQALAIAASQYRQMDWDDGWIETTSVKASLGKLWRHLKKDMASGAPGVSGLDRALRIGWG